MVNKKQTKRAKTCTGHAIWFQDGHFEVYPGVDANGMRARIPKGFSMEYKVVAVNMEVVHVY